MNLDFTQEYKLRDVISFKSPFTPIQLNPIISTLKQEVKPFFDSGLRNREDDSINRQSWSFLDINNTKPYEPFLFPLREMILRANKSYGFELEKLLELRLYEYSSSNKSLDWHMDLGVKEYSRRKLSFSLNLCSPNEYTGGNLNVFLDVGENFTPAKDYGVITFFPSYLLHKVTPIKSGLRTTIVGMLGGKPFR